MAERTPQDYAIEHAEYLATSVEQYMRVRNEFEEAAQEADEDGDGGEIPDGLRDALSDHWRGLTEAVYEFRKRAERAKAAKTSGDSGA
jgi:hypothetical protein